MSILTKVFVVLVTVLAVALVALIIPFVANTENYREQLAAERSQRQAVETQTKVLQKVLADSTEGANTQLAQLRSETDGLRLQVAALLQQVSVAQADLIRARADAAKATSDTTRLSSTLAQNEAILKSALDEVAKRRQEMVQQETKVIQLAERNNELQNQKESLERQFRRLNEEKTQMEEEKSALEKALAAVPEQFRPGARAEVAVPFPAPVGLQGQITKVETVAGKIFAQINIGKADRVAPNMKFLVHRDNKFMGNLIILSVDDRTAAGSLELPQGELLVGDSVQSSGI